MPRSAVKAIVSHQNGRVRDYDYYHYDGRHLCSLIAVERNMSEQIHIKESSFVDVLYVER